MNNDHTINRIALLYRDLLSKNVHSLSNSDKEILLSLEPTNKIIAIGDIDNSNWNAYPLTYLLNRKLVAPTVLDESKIYQSIQAMRTGNKSILHPQTLISQSVIIRIVGLDSSPSINDYINTFISMCIASDECKIIFVIVDGTKKRYKDSIYTRKTNSTFIDASTSKPYAIESTPLCVSPDQIVFFNYSRQMSSKASQKSVLPQNKNITSNKKRGLCSSMFNDPDMF